MLLDLMETFQSPSYLTFQQHSKQPTYLLEIPSPGFSSYLWLHFLKLLPWISFFYMTSKCCSSGLSLTTPPTPTPPLPSSPAQVLKSFIIFPQSFCSTAFLMPIQNAPFMLNASLHTAHTVSVPTSKTWLNSLFPRMPHFPLLTRHTTHLQRTLDLPAAD